MTSCKNLSLTTGKMKTGTGVTQGQKPKCFAKSEAKKTTGYAVVEYGLGGQVGVTDACNGRPSSSLYQTNQKSEAVKSGNFKKTRRGCRAGKHVRDTREKRRDYGLFVAANGIWRQKGLYEAYLDTSSVQTRNLEGQVKPRRVEKQVCVTHTSLNPIPQTWVNERRLAALKLQRENRAARIAAESHIVHLECENLAAKWLMFAAITHVRKDTGRGVPCGGTNNISKTRHVGFKHSSDSGTVVERASLRGHKEWRKFGNKSGYCSSGGAAGRSSNQNLKFKDGRSITVARNRVTNMMGKAHALHFIYDNIDPSQARVTLRRASEKMWREELLRSDGINSPYKHEADALTRFLVGKPGAKKVGELQDWNRWPRNLEHGDRWLEAWLRDNPWATKDIYGREYQTEPYGFSLKIDKGAQGWTEAKMKDWSSPVVSLHARDLRRAVKIVSDRYAGVLGEYMSATQVRESAEYKKTKNKSLGFFGSLGNNKLEVAQHPKFKSAVREFMTLNLPAFHMAFPKPETLKISKITKKGPRMIVGAALEMEFVERMATQKFALSMIENRWSLNSKIGIHNNEWNRLYETVAGGRILAVDYSFQDLRMPREITAHSISLRTDKLPKTFKYQGRNYETSDIQRALTHGSAASFVVGPAGDIWKREHGVASGMYNTAPVNTTNHEILNSYTLLRMGLKPIEIVNEVKENQYGDDWLAALGDKISDGRVTIKKYERECKKLNMEFTYDAFLERAPVQGPIPNNIVFLQRSFERMADGKVTARFLPNRMMAKFMTCHSDIKSARQSYERALNMLNLTGNAPHEFKIISTYIESLGYKPPKYADVMKAHYLEHPDDSMESVGRIEVVLSDLYNQTGIEGSKHWQEGQSETRTLVLPDGRRIEIKGSDEVIRPLNNEHRYYRSMLAENDFVTPRGKVFSAMKHLGYDGLKRHVRGIYRSPVTIEFEYWHFRGTRFLTCRDLPFGWRLANAIGAWYLSGPGFLIRLHIPRNLPIPDFEPVHFKATLFQGVWDWSGLLLLGGDVEENPGPVDQAGLNRLVDEARRWAKKVAKNNLKKKNDAKGIHPDERRKVVTRVQKHKWSKWFSEARGITENGDFTFNDICMSWEDAKSLGRGLARKSNRLLLFSPACVNFASAFVEEGDPTEGEQFLSAIWNEVRLQRKEKLAMKEAAQAQKAFGVMTDEEKHRLMQEVLASVGKDKIVDDFLSEHFVAGTTLPGSDEKGKQTDAAFMPLNKTKTATVEEEEEQLAREEEKARLRIGMQEALAVLSDYRPLRVPLAGMEMDPGSVFDARRSAYALKSILEFVAKYPDDTYVTRDWQKFIDSRLHFWLSTASDNELVTSFVCIMCGQSDVNNRAGCYTHHFVQWKSLDDVECRCDGTTCDPTLIGVEHNCDRWCKVYSVAKSGHKHECGHNHPDKTMYDVEWSRKLVARKFAISQSVQAVVCADNAERGLGWVKRVHLLK
ncbi:RNA-dependent RNA polymerase [Yado-kari virus 2]|uniref:RNA-dependent RNA polymerase n=1 Tax=Yado-kari virus 2 TaxID=2056548 RepID=A0ABM7EZJ0_9VIRU|nr:RNA-dependent RNA polymerase [Yado-kari virus 2]BBB86807.2 RNA-dependent RNA polymerase [Yado-kari virus 2]